MYWKLEASKLAESRKQDLKEQSLKLNDNLEALYAAIYDCQQAALEDLSCPALDELELHKIDSALINKRI